MQSETDNFPILLKKKWTFHKLYKFLKEHTKFVFNKDIPQTSCLCGKWEDLTVLAKCMSPELNLSSQTNINSLLECYYCDSSSKSGMYSTCDECCDAGLKVKGFKDDCTEIQFYQLKRVD